MPETRLPRRASAAPRRIALASLTAVAVAAASALVAVPAATAAVGDSYKYYGSYVSASVRLAAPDAGTFSARSYALQGQSGAASTSGDYSVDFHGTPPANNNDYVQAEWAEPLLPAVAVEARGEVEWILKNSYPVVDTSRLRDAIRASDPSFPQGYFSESEAVAGTQAAIWHLTDGVDLDLANTSPNTDRVKKLYAWLLANADGAPATTGAAPRLDVISDGGRTAFSLEPGGAAGPFTVASSTPVTLTVKGDAARIVDASGSALTGTLPADTVFYVQPTSSPALPGSATVTATGQSVTTTVLRAAKGSHNVAPYAPRETLAQLSSTTQKATDTQAVSWTIDQTSAGSFDPDGAATERTYNYYRPGVLSATLERISFTDGTTTETDLLGIQGSGSTASADVYSADFATTTAAEAQTGWRGPALRDNSRLAEVPWTADAAGELTWILQHSYPTLSTSKLTAALADRRDANTGDIKNWEAIAATQAAIWHYTDGKDLDTTRYLDPVSETTATTDAGAPAIDFAFAVPVELRDYAVTSLGSADAPTSWKLQRSSDGGQTWTDVSSSATTHTFAGPGTKRTVLGASATYGGYRDYRLVVTDGRSAEQPVDIADVHFDGFGVFGSQPNDVYREYANNEDVVAAYEYLLEGANAEGPAALPAAPSVSLAGAQTSFETTKTPAAVGPFTLEGSTSARVAVAGADGVAVRTAADATDAEQLVLDAGESFWVFPGANRSAELTVTADGSAVNAVSVRGICVDGEERPALLQLGVASSHANASLAISLTPAAEPVPQAPAWDSRTVYTGGENVSYDGRLFRAQWWTQGDVPGSTPWGSWTEIASPVDTSEGAAPAWASSTVYTGGETVAFQGSLWIAQWWTRNQEPGASEWGPWTRVS
ncbi:Cys-Gln thioester bond-forming surface protein [Microbacterium ulmi]|uniref:Cys-Gln thioester bond-forming surface protein n=1 Tax=Microbacterium ulmi TaxID=179095 RepID=A0A7Y2Q0C8_9MICO|nr:Cys-Gln thioester bond-forming surface protein [Microbacterium ulmi]NII68604.1 TQXA domain-containing protein [Microbacterium ulmi]NNH05426.1 Cys-Gln thioester bond-forming surface protein [Microbacterium ulmi]